jgi:hypothetical protein
MGQAFQVDVSGAVSQLEGLLARASLSPKDAARCARLAEALRRPARLCLMGPAAADLAWLLAGLVGRELVDPARMPPVLEVAHGPAPRTSATLGDGSTLSQPGLPGPDILAQAPVFLSVETPAEGLRRMSVLALCLEADPALHVPAMAWAARRSEIAIWCTGRFGAADAAIWAAAPERLRHHAFLVELAPGPGPAAAGADFLARFAAGGRAPGDVVAALRDRLAADMEEALAADIDATRLFLHRLGHATAAAPVTPAVPAAAPAPAPATAPPAATPAPAPARAEARRALFSEPLLYLTRRARTLAQALAWLDDGDAWPDEVLAGCAETAEGLRDRAASWPEDDPVACALRAAIDEMGDTALLLQIEGGADAAETAAALMGQMRRDFEQALARPPAPEPGGGR